MKVTFKKLGGGYYRLSTGEKIRGLAAVERRVAEIAESGRVDESRLSTGKKTIDSLSPAHARWVARFEGAIAEGGGLAGVDHVWAATRRDRGRAAGRVYLAVKFGARDYRLVAFDESDPTEAAVELGVESASPTEIMAEFRAYRALAKVERAEAAAS